MDEDYSDDSEGSCEFDCDCTDSGDSGVCDEDSDDDDDESICEICENLEDFETDYEEVEVRDNSTQTDLLMDDVDDYKESMDRIQLAQRITVKKEGGGSAEPGPASRIRRRLFVDAKFYLFHNKGT